jgi:sirohydrochlorin cobaltochelatase
MMEWRDAAVLLVGHGSSRLTTSRQVTDRLAEALRSRQLFAEVAACFWKEPPFVSLDLVRASTVFIVPNFAGDGLFTRRLIPERLGLTGTLTERDNRRLLYARPVGCHPRLPALLLERARTLCADQGLAPAETGLLLVGHGSRQPGTVSATPEAAALELAAAGLFAAVKTAYLEQDPPAAQWQSLLPTTNIVVAPWLISEGMHASQDLPALFGASAPTGGPIPIHGRRVWLMGGIGRETEVVDMILDQIRQAEAIACPTFHCQERRF